MNKKIESPIFDFIKKYSKKNNKRFHMPGHKGKGVLGVEKYDLTEIDGADALFSAKGIIAQSEKYCSDIFGCPTYYSTEGSSLSIRAMVYIAMQYAKKIKRKPLILAGRNYHKSFLSAVALLGVSVETLYPEDGGSYLSCNITANEIEKRLKSTDDLPVAVYITSPDYLGNIIDVSQISAVCKKYGVLLLVDNAHGAYLKFLNESKFPIDLGADICCSSAHKTLPVLTGGAYLHISESFLQNSEVNPKQALSLFASTSPSYLILSSLDIANKTLSKEYIQKVSRSVRELNDAKKILKEKGYEIVGLEPLKLTIKTKSYGYLGFEIAKSLSSKGIVCEFCDPDYIVFMISTENSRSSLKFLVKQLLTIKKREAILSCPPEIVRPKVIMDIQTAVLSEQEELETEKCFGRIFGLGNISCPPAVSILSAGELIDKTVIEVLKYYNITTCIVVKE